MIICGNGDPIHAAREQWNDGSNVLTVKPNVVIAYGRNHITNAALREAGVIVHEIHSSELSRGRGGPRCMSMPLYREDVNWELLKASKELQYELTREFKIKK
jgi:arginine deiminase